MNDKEKKPQPPQGESEIDALNKQLYKREEPKDFQFRIEGLRTKKPKKNQAGKDASRPELVDVMKKRNQTHRQLLLWGGVGAAALLAFGVAAWATVAYRASQEVADRHVELGIVAPQEFTAGEEITYVLQYKNASRVDWKNVELTFTPPNGFRFYSSTPAAEPAGHRFAIGVGDLASGQSGEVTFIGQLLGEQQSTALGQVEIALSPANFEKSRITKSETVNTLIAAVPLEVSVEATNNAADGERVIAQIRVRNTSSIPLAGARLRIQPATGLELMTEDTSFTEGFSVLDAWWELPELDPLEDHVRTVVMRAVGQPGERRILEAIGLVVEDDQQFVLRSVDHVITLSSAELAVQQIFNTQAEDLVVTAGQPIEAVVKFRNVGTTGLKNVIVKVQIEGTGFDASSLKLPAGGAYDPVSRTITWTVASIPALGTVQPGQEGELTYSFSVLPTEQFPATPEAKNPTITAIATIDSPDLPTPTGQDRRVITDQFIMPVASNVTLEPVAFYDDGRLGLESSGPVPPKVGEQTTYTVRFRLGSTLSDIGDVNMLAVLPDGVHYTGNIYKTAGEVDFNERTQEIHWSVAQIEGQAGRSLPAPELHIQVAITPGENVRGQSLQLVQSAQAEALDLFADQTVTTAAQVNALPTTSSASPQNGIVQ